MWHLPSLHSSFLAWKNNGIWFLYGDSKGFRLVALILQFDFLLTCAFDVKKSFRLLSIVAVFCDSFHRCFGLISGCCLAFVAGRSSLLTFINCELLSLFGFSQVRNKKSVTCSIKEFSLPWRQNKFYDTSPDQPEPYCRSNNRVSSMQLLKAQYALNVLNSM